MTNPDPQIIAQQYVDTWNETDPEKRRALVAAVWAEDASYIDPMMQARGREAICSLIEGVQGRFPDLRFKLSGRGDGYGDRARFSWDFGPGDSEAVVQGTDFAVIAGDGRLQAVTGFIDRLPAEGDAG